MIPFIPSELVTIIFEQLYDILCYVPGRGMYDTPTGAGFVFSRLSLVSKTWHSLALPFLVRNFDNSRDGTKSSAFVGLVHKYGLARYVETISLIFTEEEASISSASDLLEHVNPQQFEISCYSDTIESFFSVFPFLQNTTGLILSGSDFQCPVEWTLQLPSRLTTFDYTFKGFGAPHRPNSDSLAIALVQRCSRTLRVLSLRAMWPIRNITSTDLFGNTVFPSVKTLYVSACNCAYFDAVTHFPQLQSASLNLLLRSGFAELPILPPFLKHLAFLNITEEVLERIADNLQSLLNSVKSLEVFEICAYMSDGWPGNFSYSEELQEHRHFVEVSNICQLGGVRFKCYVWDQIFRVLDKKLSKLPSRSSKEEEDLDYDAEDGEEFRHLWSREKLAELEEEGTARSS